MSITWYCRASKLKLLAKEYQRLHTPPPSSYYGMAPVNPPDTRHPPLDGMAPVNLPDT